MPNFKVIRPFVPAIQSNCRYIDIWGGRGRGGSYYGTQYFLMRIMHPSYFRGYFVRQTFGDIRDSLFRDFKDRMEEMADAGELDINDFHIQENEMRILYKPTGNIINSKGVNKDGQRTAKMKSLAGATHVLIEEADEIAEQDFNQLDDSLRTTKTEAVQIIRIFNPPPKKHWIWRDYILTDSDVEGYMVARCKNDEIFSVFSTYLDNLSNISESTQRKYESYKLSDPEYYYCTIKGLVSEGKRGRIYTGWNIITDAEFDAIDAMSIYGLDFGYSVDPTALIEVKMIGQNIYARELIYQPGLDNFRLMELMAGLGITSNDCIIADTGGGGDLRIAELRLGCQYAPEGFYVLGAIKPAGSVNAGISAVKQHNVFMTNGSANLINEYNSYAWALDKYKEPTDTPKDKDNHLLDALRYVVLSKNNL